MESTMREQVKSYARNCLELNADAPIITAVLDACSFYEVDVSDAEAEEIAFEIIQE